MHECFFLVCVCVCAENEISPQGLIKRVFLFFLFLLTQFEKLLDATSNVSVYQFKYGIGDQSPFYNIMQRKENERAP